MKIAIYSDNFYPEISGISDSIILLAKELAKRGHQINFYVPRYSKKNFEIAKYAYQEIDLGENINIFRLPSISFPGSPTKQGRIALPVLSSFRHIKKFNPDIIYSQDIFPCGLEALMITKILRKPFLGTNHTPMAEFMKYSPINFKWTEKLCLKYVSWYYNRCQFVSAPNKSIISEMKKYGFKKTSRTISNPIELHDFKSYEKERKRALKKELGLSEHTVIYTGRLAPEKQIDVAIRAMAKVKKVFPDINLALTGHGIAEKSLRKLVKKLKLENSVKFFGFVEYGEKYTNLYNACDIFTVTSTAEMQCLSMMQAMACALPVIAVNAWALPEYVNSKNGYIIDIDDYQDLAEKIIYLFQNPGKISELGQGGLEYVKNFSSEKIAEAWEEIFLRFIKK